MNPHSPRLTAGQRAEIHRRHLAGEKGSQLAEEFGVSRQRISQIIIQQRKIAESGELEPARRRRDLNQLIPRKLQALRALMLSHSPAELGLTLFPCWSSWAAQRAMQQWFHFRLMQSEAEHFLAEWGIVTPATLRGRPRKEEVFEQDFYDYINSPIGRQVEQRTRESEARDLALAEARREQGFKRGPGRPPKQAATPAQDSRTGPEEDRGFLSLEEMERRLNAAAAHLDGEGVQSVLDYYGERPKPRGSNFTPKKKKRRK